MNERFLLGTSPDFMGDQFDYLNENPWNLDEILAESVSLCCDSEPGKHFIYIAFDEDDVIRYVGMGQRDRANHVNSGKSHNGLLNEYVSSGRKFQIEKLSENISQSKAAISEKFLVETLGRVLCEDGPLFNISDGGIIGERGEIWWRHFSAAMAERSKCPKWLDNVRAAAARRSANNLDWLNNVKRATAHRVANNVEWRKNVIEAGRKRAADPKWQASNKAVTSNPDWIRLHSARLREMARDPEIRARARATLMNNDRFFIEQAQRNKKQANDPVWQQKNLEGAQKRVNNPEWIKNTTNANREKAKCPIWREKNRQGSIKRSNNAAWVEHWQNVLRRKAKPLIVTLPDEYDNLEIFVDSGNGFAKDMGICQASISLTARGKQKKTHGLRIRYATPDEIQLKKPI
jgi:hypothetical protein